MTSGSESYGVEGGFDVYQYAGARQGQQFAVAPHLGHAYHLCNLAMKGTDLNTVKKLVRNAKYLCKICGRAAANQENLCEPIPL